VSLLKIRKHYSTPWPEGQNWRRKVKDARRVKKAKPGAPTAKGSESLFARRGSRSSFSQKSQSGVSAGNSSARRPSPPLVEEQRQVYGVRRTHQRAATPKLATEGAATAEAVVNTLGLHAYFFHMIMHSSSS
jgi:hypothetical protein